MEKMDFMDFINMLVESASNMIDELDNNNEDECDCANGCKCDNDALPEKCTESKYPSEPVLSRNLFGVFTHNLLEHIKFDEMLHKTSSGMIDLRNNCYYETDMVQVLKFVMDDKDGRISEFIEHNKQRLNDGGNVADNEAIDALYNLLLYDYRQRRFEEAEAARHEK